MFETTLVTLELRDNAGILIDTGQGFYYAGGWKEIGPTVGGKVSTQLLPITYSFRMSYGGKSNDVQQDVSANPIVVFQAASPVPTVKLIDSFGNGILGATVQYYAGGWKEFGTTDASGAVSKDILPGNYSFRASYGGATLDKKQDVSVNPLVIIQTVKARVELIDSTGAALDPGTVQYYAGGWKEFGATSGGSAEKELLPGNYSFRMTFANGSIDKKQDTSTGPVIFQTRNIAVKLINSTGQPIDTGLVQYYAGGWRTFGTTINGIANKELLPAQYSFRMTYASGSNDKSQDIPGDPMVVFQTGQVVSASGNCTQYYAGGWKPFSNGADLLPNTYKFRFKTGTPDKDYTINAGIVNTIQ